MTGKRDTDPDSLVATAKQEARKGVKKLAPALVGLLVVLAGYWSTRITMATVSAQEAAESAEAKGEQGKAVAAKVKVENQAGYDATKEKVDASGDVLAQLVVEVKALREEVEKLKAARTGRPRRHPTAVKVPPVVTEPLPPTPAAAAQEQAAPP